MQYGTVESDLAGCQKIIRNNLLVLDRRVTRPHSDGICGDGQSIGSSDLTLVVVEPSKDGLLGSELMVQPDKEIILKSRFGNSGDVFPQPLRVVSGHISRRPCGNVWQQL